MTDVRFYHLANKSPEQAVPAILEKALQKGHKVVIKTASPAETSKLNDALWTYRPDSFLPHGDQKDGYAEDQLIWLTETDENPNGADVLVLMSGTTSPQMKDYALCCEMIDGRDEAAVAASREHWKAYKDEGFSVTYWQQTEVGKWEQKA